MNANQVDTKTPIGAALAKVYQCTLNEAKHVGHADAAELDAILTGATDAAIIDMRHEAFLEAGYAPNTIDVKKSMIRRLYAAAQTGDGRRCVEAMAEEGAPIHPRTMKLFAVPTTGKGSTGRPAGQGKGETTAPADEAANDPQVRIAAWVTETQGLCANAVKLIPGMSAEDCSAMKDLLSNMAEEARQAKALALKYAK